MIAYLNGILLPTLNVPLTETPIENATDVVTADNNMYTTFAISNNKKLWTLNWDILTEAQYNLLKSIYDSQFTTYQYPLLTIPHYEVEDMPVRMNISPREVWKYCGDVRSVVVTLRESVIPPEWDYGSS